MLYLKKLKLHNWEGFADTTLDLEPTQYAIVGENAAGKSSILRAIAYVLTNGRTDSDSWIRRGEKSGEVFAELSDGTTISRKRIVGSSTNILLTVGGQNFAKDVAIDRISQIMGVSRNDYFATYYFEQRAMARFILASPTDRMELISSWIGLERLEEMGANLAIEMSEKDTALNSINAQRDALGQSLTQVITAYKSIDDLRSMLRDWRVKLSDVEAVMKEQTELVRANATRTQLEEQLRLIRSQGANLVKQLEQIGDAPEQWTDVDEENLVRAQSQFASHKSEYDRAIMLLKGSNSFSGKCPVNGRSCPVKDEINGDHDAASAKCREAEALYTEADLVISPLMHRKRSAENYERKSAALTSQIESMREQARTIATKLEAMPPLVELLNMDDIRRQHHEASTQVERMNSLIANYDQAQTKFDELTTRREQIEQELSGHRALRVIVGRNGAQREIAEKILAVIEFDANTILAECGIDLTIKVSWAREGSGVADYCDTCGTPFPASVRVKVCARCNSPRGPKIVNKLDVSLSRKSGAMEDLAGIAIQFAASLWLSRHRSTNWSSVMVDEPFGALDPKNRMAFSQHLHSILKHYGEQAFVVSHTPDTQSALPGRIEVEMHDGCSSARII